MDASDAIIDVRGLGVVRGETTILDAIDWRVRRGEHWAMLGANGSGKTSLLQSLTAYLTPTRGVITIDGQTYGQSDWPALRRRIGLVSAGISQRVPFDEEAIDTVLSGPAAQLGFWTRDSDDDLAVQREQARECLERMACAYLAERPWGYLSQGERQRVFIARALMAEPVLLFLDEPCSGLDPVMREHFLNGVEALAARDDAPTLVLVTHHVEEVRPVFTRALVLRGGRILAQGATETVFTNQTLSSAFDAPMTITRTQRRWSLSLS